MSEGEDFSTPIKQHGGAPIGSLTFVREKLLEIGRYAGLWSAVKGLARKMRFQDVFVTS